MNKNYYIRSLLDEAIEILSPMRINYNTKAGNHTRALMEIIAAISPLIKDEYPSIYGVLQSVHTHIVRREKWLYKCLFIWRFANKHSGVGYAISSNG